MYVSESKLKSLQSSQTAPMKKELKERKDLCRKAGDEWEYLKKRRDSINDEIKLLE